MPTTNPSVLLVGSSPAGVSSLAIRFKRWACETHFASSNTQAIASVRDRPFDLLVSEFKLREGSSSPLVASLLGSNSTLIYSYPVETGCWWLPAVKNGLSCWGSPAMRPKEFMRFLEDFLTVVRLRQDSLEATVSENVLEILPEQPMRENMQQRRGNNSRPQPSVDAA
jgi:hypothetical protein